MSEHFNLEIVNPEKSFLKKDNVAEVIVPGFELYSALLNVNFKSSLGSDVQVEPFCDLNNTPAYGCCDIVLSEFNCVSPSLAAYTL